MGPLYRPQSTQAKKDSADGEMMVGLSTRIKTIDAGAVTPKADTAFKDVKLVGGYNWIDSKEPSIVVPGTSYRVLVWLQ